MGEKGTNPNVYIYEYPSLRLYRILRSGTERAFTAASFSQDGRQLATARAAAARPATYASWRFALCVWKAAQ